MWALTQPRIDADFLLLDEAQDTNPVVEQIFLAQRDHAQLVMVGDSAQAIYDWRGARDVMTGFDGTQLTLSQSFRFGPHLAEEANRWLHLADAPIRLTGTETIPTELGPLTRPDAVLCRTNVGAMTEVMGLLAAGHRVALAGGGDSLRALALAARDLKEGRRTTHPELVLFPSWGELQDYAAHDPAGRDLQPLVDLVDTHGTDAILAAVDQLAPEAARPGDRLHRPQGQRPRMARREDRGRLHPAQGHRPARRRRASPYPDPSTTAKPASPTSPSPAPATASTSAACPGSTNTHMGRPDVSPALFTCWGGSPSTRWHPGRSELPRVWHPIPAGPGPTPAVVPGPRDVVGPWTSSLTRPGRVR